MALLHPERIADPAQRAEVERLSAGYADPGDYFVERLAEGVGTIAAAFWPRDVIVRLSDFKTNEYAGLLGGAAFEPAEENPMLGFRGASRYYDERYREAFALECRALLRVRETMGLTNVKVMVPFCRTVDEGRRVVAEMAANGLVRGENGLEVYVMCEIPANVILAAEFAEVFDGFSIGSNDLTQLVLGVDRDSALVARLFDERNPAVTRMVARGDPRRAGGGPQDRHLRPGAQRLPGVRALPGGAGDRQHLPEPRRHRPHHPRGAGAGAPAGRATARAAGAAARGRGAGARACPGLRGARPVPRPPFAAAARGAAWACSLEPCEGAPAPRRRRVPAVRA